MASDFAKSLLKVSVAQICQNIGWNAVQGSPLEVLVDILHRYLFELSKTTHQYSNQYGRSQPNLIDLGLAFRLMGVQLSELEEYVNNVEPVPFAHQVAAFPLQHRSNFQFPKTNSRAVAQRPEWIHEHLPVTHPEQDDVLPPSPIPEDPSKRVHTIHDSDSSESDEMSPSNPNKTAENGKRRKGNQEEEGRPMREMSYIFMTPSGLITPALEGKLPEPGTPTKAVESASESPEISVSGNSSSSSSESLPHLLPKKPFKSIKKDKAKMMKIKKDLVLKKQIKKMKLAKKQHKLNPIMKSGSVKMEPLHSPPTPSHSSVFVKKDTGSRKDIIMGGEGVKIKSKKKKSSSSSSSTSPKISKNSNNKPVINKIRIAKDKTMKLAEMIKTPKKHSGKSHAITSPFQIPQSPKSSKSAKFSTLPKSTALNKSPKIPINIHREKSPGSSHRRISPLPNLPHAHKTIIHDTHQDILPVKIEPLQALRPIVVEDEDDIPSREDTPEPRLIIDDEAQARIEKESRMQVLDDCISAVIMRATEEFEVGAKRVDDAIDSVIKNSGVKKLEPRDVYDFTDSSNDANSLPQTPKTPEPSANSPPVKVKKDKTKSSPDSGGLKALGSDMSKKKKIKATKRRQSRDKPKPPPLSLSKFGRSGTQRAPSPSFDDSDSSDIQSLPSPGGGGPTPQSQLSPLSARNSFGNFQQPNNNSLFSSLGSHKFPSMGFSPTPNPFSPLRSLTSNPFPTPPLFVPPPKMMMDQMATQVQPLNLVLSAGGSSSNKERKGGVASSSSPGSSTQDTPKKGSRMIDEDFGHKGKAKDHKRKPEKKEKPKKKIKEKMKVKKDSPPIISIPPPPPPRSPSPLPPTPSPPPSPPTPEPKKVEKKIVEKNANKPKVEKRGRPSKVEKEKKKAKEMEKQAKDDPSIPKITFKLGGNTPHASGSAKIVIKSSAKGAASPSPTPPDIKSHSPVPSTPSPVIPPAPPRPSTPPPPPPPIVTLPPISPPPINVKSPPGGSGGARGRPAGRGRGSAKRAASPTPCIVTTETLGTIVDASGNKIWICPACTRPDDGSPMIGCDECDDWYHWVCVGIVVPPKEEESWFCTRCISKRHGGVSKKKRKKHRKEK